MCIRDSRVIPGSDQRPGRDRDLQVASLASASFVDFVTVDDGASVHDAHMRTYLDAALSDYDNNQFVDLSQILILLVF